MYRYIQLRAICSFPSIWCARATGCDVDPTAVTCVGLVPSFEKVVVLLVVMAPKLLQQSRNWATHPKNNSNQSHNWAAAAGGDGHQNNGKRLLHLFGICSTLKLSLLSVIYLSGHSNYEAEEKLYSLCKKGTTICFVSQGGRCNLQPVSPH